MWHEPNQKKGFINVIEYSRVWLVMVFMSMEAKYSWVGLVDNLILERKLSWELVNELKSEDFGYINDSG